MEPRYTQTQKDGYLGGYHTFGISSEFVQKVKLRNLV